MSWRACLCDTMTGLLGQQIDIPGTLADFASLLAQ